MNASNRAALLGQPLFGLILLVKGEITFKKLVLD